MQPLQFFIDNIGKRIYRDSDGCDCLGCKDIVENGLIITDETQAGYLFDIQNDFGADDIELNYRLMK